MWSGAARWPVRAFHTRTGYDRGRSDPYETDESQNEHTGAGSDTCAPNGLCLLVGLQVRAEDSLEDLKRQKTEARDRVDDARSKLNQAAESKQGLERELDLLSDRIKTTRQTMDENNRKISSLQEELGQAQADKSGRLAAMKLRIRYMYEQGSSNDLLELFFTSENFADFLAKFDYAAQLTRYEQKMIGEMEKLQEEIDAKAADLSSRQDALQEEQETLLGQQDEMNRLLASASDEVRMKYMDYSGARDRLKQIDQSIADMQAALMAEQKRNEARKLAEADRIARQAEAAGQKADQKADPGEKRARMGLPPRTGHPPLPIGRQRMRRDRRGRTTGSSPWDTHSRNWRN